MWKVDLMDSNDFACACFVLITKVGLLLIKMLWTQFTLGDADGSCGDGFSLFCSSLFFASVVLNDFQRFYMRTHSHSFHFVSALFG